MPDHMPDRRPIFVRLEELLGDGADAWMASGHPDLPGRTPMDAWRDGEREAVHLLVDRMALGLPAPA